MPKPHGAAPPVPMLLTMMLYGVEVAGLIAGLALYKYVDRLASLTIRQAAGIFLPLACTLACAAIIGRCYRAMGTRRFAVVVAANLVTVVMLIGAGEAVLRCFAVPGPKGLSVGNTVLLPKDWDDVRRRNAALLAHAPSSISYFVSDSLLGWTVGRGRRSTDGLYASSAEGIRSARSDVASADRRPSTLIAAVGDSYTFGLEVPFEDAWTFRLAEALGPQFGVWNFGVDGYGVDQAYLRYNRDVRPWRPALAVFGFIAHDLGRSMVVYPFISFPEWEFPFAKPRFVLDGAALRLLNTPLLSPADITGYRSVTELPFIDHEPGYNPVEWQRHPIHALYTVRYLVSRFPRWRLANPNTDGAAVDQLNSQLLLSFLRDAAADGTEPLIVYFPSRGDFLGQDRSGKEAVLRILSESGADPLDLTACIAPLGSETAFIRHRPHYSAEGNAAVARCLLPVVLERVQRIRSRRDAAPPRASSPSSRG
jgi:hypothetical protein